MKLSPKILPLKGGSLRCHLLVTSDQIHTTDANSLVAHKADLARFTTKHWISRRVGSKPRRLLGITVPPIHKTSAGKNANRS